MAKDLSVLEIHQKMSETFSAYYDFRKFLKEFMLQKGEQVSDEETMFLFKEFKEHIRSRNWGRN